MTESPMTNGDGKLSAEQFSKSQAWYDALGAGCSDEVKYWFKFAEAFRDYDASEREAPPLTTGKLSAEQEAREWLQDSKTTELRWKLADPDNQLSREDREVKLLAAYASEREAHTSQLKLTPPVLDQRDFVVYRDGWAGAAGSSASSSQFSSPNSEREARARQEGREAGLEEAATYMIRCSERWVESLPIDEVASLNCKQAAKGIRALKSSPAPKESQ